MRVIGICGSPRKGGNSEIMLQEALKAAEAKGAETELIILADKEINCCKGLNSCPDECEFKDDMQEIYKKLEEADAIILATPVWFNNVSSTAKVFMDRCVFLARKKRLAGKKLGVITVTQSKHGGNELVFNIIRDWASSCKLEIVGARQRMYSKFGAMGVGKQPGDVKNDEESLESARKLGEAIVG